jgi:putative glycosyltransferase (TIGR04372 family)
LLPFRLACFNMRAFGHLCLEPYLLRIDESVRARVFALAGGAVANRALYDFLKTRYPVIEDRWLIGLLATLYSWRFLQVDVGNYVYSRRDELPTYASVLQKYGSGDAAVAYRHQFCRFIGRYSPEPKLAEFLAAYPKGYVVAHWRVDDSKVIHNIRNSRGLDLIDAIRTITAEGYGICIGGDGYQNDPSCGELARIKGVYFPARGREDSDLADVWLLTNACFGVFGDSGISCISVIHRTPAVIHNFSAVGLPSLNPFWIRCFKSYRFKATGMEVPMEELRRLNLTNVADGNVCAAHGIIAVDCSAAEISEAVRTLLQRLSTAEPQ